jgi:glucokinase
MKPVAAIDIGGTKLAIALVNPDGRVLERAKAPVRKDGVAATVEQIVSMFSRWRDVSAAGVCIPGIYYADTGLAWTPNLWGWDAVPLRDELAARLPVPIAIDSDRSAYVLGEQWLGAAQGLTDVVFVAVGTGIGAGILSGGRLIRGVNGIAGAVGWFALSPERKGAYAQTGCFEAEAAGPAVARRMGAESAEAVVASARQGDAAARAALAETARWLGMGVANLISALNPQMVVLGGGLMQAGDLLIAGVRRAVLEWAQPVAARDTRIELSRLGEDAGLMGAARLALGGF